MLSRMHAPGTRDVVRFHQRRDRYVIAARNRFERLAGRHRDRGAALPRKARWRWRRRWRQSAGDVAVAGLVGPPAAGAAGNAIAKTRQCAALNAVARLWNRSGNLAARAVAVKVGKTAGIGAAG